MDKIEIYDETINLNLNDFSEITEEFFQQLKIRLISIFKQKKGIETIISNIVNNSDNINKTLNYISKNIAQFLLNISNEFTKKHKNFLLNDDINNNINNYDANLTNTKLISKPKKINKNDEFEIVFNKNFENNNNDELPFSLNNLPDITVADKESFKKIIDILKIKKYIERILENRSIKKMQGVLKTVPGRCGINYLLPDENGNKFQYHILYLRNKTIYLKCADVGCKAKGSIDKINFDFKLLKPHTKLYTDHTYIKKSTLNKINNHK